MKILNYTTEVAAAKSVGEIQALLAAHKCQAILCEFDDKGNVTALSFRIRGPFGMMSYRLPSNVDKVAAVIFRAPGIPQRLRTREQACRVAWRILKDWTEAQLAIIQAQMVTLEQVFLPYAQNADGVTVYESLSANSFAGLALPEGRPSE